MDATTPAKRSRRLQSPEFYSKTTVYVVCHKPYKATLLLPRLGRLSKEDVREAVAADGNCHALPKLPHGHFEVVLCRDDGTQVALFKFKDVAGCRRVSSTQHGTLSLPRARRIPMEFLVQPTTLQVGFHYMFGYNHPYEIQDGKVCLKSVQPPEWREFPDELHRTGEMLTRLRAPTTHHNYKIELASHDATHYCPFSGGGDICIFKTGSSLGAVLVTPAEQEPAEDPTLLEHASPSQEGQYTCGAIENKVGSCQHDQEVRLQLQAYMMLLCAKLLSQEIAEGHDVKQLICYGVALGVVKYPLTLLKLTIDFGKREAVYDELCKISPCPAYSAYIDLALTYVIKNV